MNAPSPLTAPQTAAALITQVLAPIKASFVGKEVVIDLLGLCLVAGEHCFILGPPGTAKSALVQALGRRLAGRTFDYLLTRFTEPNELFGPFDIRRLREGDLVTNTDGMLPEADLVFLDELLNANSAVLNSLLMVLNERVFRRGRETRALPMLMAVGASNRLPEDETLRALFDRFLVRVRSDNVADERLSEVLVAGWKLEDRSAVADPFPIAGIRHLRQAVREVDLTTVRPVYASIISRLRHAGIPLSDRRAVRLQGLVAASAILCGRSVAQVSDCWVLRHTWDTEEQRELLEATVAQALEQAQERADDHPQAREAGAPDAEVLAGEVTALEAEFAAAALDATTLSRVRDRLSLLLCRLPWIANSTARTALQQQTDALWARLSTP